MHAVPLIIVRGGRILETPFNHTKALVQNPTMIIRTVFVSGVTMGAIKYTVGFNHCGVSHNKVDNNAMLQKCPRCDKCKTWEHVVQYHALTNENKAFMTGIRAKKEKAVETEEEINSINCILKDMEKHLIIEDDEFETNQSIIGWKYAFRGCVVKA